MSTLAATLVASLALVALPRAASALAALAGALVPVDVDLEHIVERQNVSRPSVVLASDGTVLGHFRPEELHEPLRFDEIAPAMLDATVASEDADFWDHGGIDLSAIARALTANIQAGTVTQGGSTITQQLVKNLFTGAEQSLSRKLQEMRLAFAIESRYDKRTILAAYLNSAYFGGGAIGVGAAARTYFRKPAAALTLSEAALLAGLLPAPTAYDPRTYPDRAEARRQLVLDRLVATGLRSRTEVKAARAQVPQVLPPREIVAQHPFFLDYVRRWLLDVWKLEPQLLYGGGLRIHTTLLPHVQEAARQAVATHLPAPHNPETAVAVVDPHSGDVAAVVGGRDWSTSKVNLALGRLGGGSGRQPGSSFKPFVLAALLEQGGSLRDVIPAPATYMPEGSDKEVANYSRRGYGAVTVHDAMRRSINTAFVALTDRLGPGVVARLARDLGIDGLPEHPGASLGVGAYEASPLELAASYASFVNGGRRVVPRPVRRILRPDRTPLDKRLPDGLRDRVISEETARLVTAALQAVVTDGTGTAARLGRPAAGKTGTTDDYTNAWFAGYTPHLSAAVWVGFPEGNIPMRDINGVASVTGGNLPARIWHDLMRDAHRGVAVTQFPPPPVRPRSTHPAVLTTTTTTRTFDRDGRTPRGAGRPPGDGSTPPSTRPAPTTKAPAGRPTTTTAPPRRTTTTTTTAPPKRTTTTTTAPRKPATTTTTTLVPTSSSTTTTTQRRGTTTTTTASRAVALGKAAGMA